MEIVIAVTVVLILMAIVLLNAYLPSQKIPRDQFLAQFGQFVDAQIIKIEGMGESFQIPFSFEGNNFIFEDIEVLGFQGKDQKAHLKYQMDNNFILNFSEKTKDYSIRSNIVMVSEVQGSDFSSQEKLDVPKSLGVFAVQTNNAQLANKLFRDSKAVAILNTYKNKDERGRPFMSLRIVDGMISLHFHSLGHYNPSLHSLVSEISTLENYINQILVIARALS